MRRDSANLGDLGRSARERPRLVGQHEIDAGRPLEGVPAAKQDTLIRRPTRPHEDRGGRGDAERAGAGGDRDRDEDEERDREARPAEEEPCQGGNEGEAEHHRHEDGRDPVGRSVVAELGTFPPR